MAIRTHDAAFERAPDELIATWRSAGAAALSDCLAREFAMDAGVAPLSPEMGLVAQARTVRCAAGDNQAVHAALETARPGEVLVVDAHGYMGAAVWGGLMTAFAAHRGLAGIVVDGCVRDGDEIIAAGFPCFARGRTPAGPRKALGGEIDGTIACGGVVVRSGDLIVGDGDGVSVLPIDRVDEAKEALAQLQAREARALEVIAQDGSLSELYGGGR